MLKLENIAVMNLANAFKGMRNPLESWGKSDSKFVPIDKTKETVPLKEVFRLTNLYSEAAGYIFCAGAKDLELARTLIKAGPSHSKFMRQILVSMDITAPLMWWKDFDTYKVATVANSTSTMHKLGTRELVPSDFSWEELTPKRVKTLEDLNSMIIKLHQYKEEGNTEAFKKMWREIIEDLPESFNYTRTWTGNYEILRNVYFTRRGHKLYEFDDFREEIEILPHSELIILS